ncbi:hypothetical protein EB796_010294 [Bugula neritina]|uniref:Uncharacterized protein n=1 Tax=Bugula neritina TaxID=10212 RepID=A0A7J7K1F5_BUGNE|nr:hypothetical protein EB796_010294 [Bugula neritina]
MESSPETNQESDESNLRASSTLADTESCVVKPVHVPRPTRLCLNVSTSPYPVLIGNLLYGISHAANKVSLDDVVYNKICYQHFQNESCFNTAFSSKQVGLQKEAATWLNYHFYALMPMSVLSCLILSSYCDRVGFKLPYVFACLGNIFCTGYLSLLATPQFIGWPMPVTLIYSFLYSCLGTVKMTLVASVTCVGLLVPKEKRTFYLAACEGSLFLGLLIGYLINGPIIDSLGLSAMTYISLGLSVLPLIVATVFLPANTAGTSNVSTKFKLRELVNCTRFLDAFKCMFQKREGSNRLSLHLLCIVYICVSFSSGGFAAVSFLYFVKRRDFH